MTTMSIQEGWRAITYAEKSESINYFPQQQTLKQLSHLSSFHQKIIYGQETGKEKQPHLLPTK